MFIVNMFLSIYLLGCGHCKKMKPEYQEAAATLKEDEVRTPKNFPKELHSFRITFDCYASFAVISLLSMQYYPMIVALEIKKKTDVNLIY